MKEAKLPYETYSEQLAREIMEELDRAEWFGELTAEQQTRVHQVIHGGIYMGFGEGLCVEAAKHEEAEVLLREAEIFEEGVAAGLKQKGAE